MSDVLVYTASYDAQLALQQKSEANSWQSLVPQGPEPSVDGTFDIGNQGIIAANRIMLLPICDGSQGDQFSVRVYSWRVLRAGGGSRKNVWVPLFLAEFLCTAGALTGPGDNAARLVPPNARFCSGIALTSGTLGKDGVINVGGGSSSVAYAILALDGATKIQFDFQQSSPVGMNSLWAKC